RGKLFARASGGDVKLALELTMDPGWHIYEGPTRLEMGGPTAVGDPTRVELQGDGTEWSSWRYPPAKRVEQDFVNSWIHEYSGTITLFARGRANGGADLAKLVAKVIGQTCDESGCVKYELALHVEGAGPDATFAQFPSDLAVGATTSGGGASGSSTS